MRLDFNCFSSKSQYLRDKNIAIINVTNSDDYKCRLSISDDCNEPLSKETWASQIQLLSP